MLCGTSGAARTSIGGSRASTGQVVGATKHTCGRAPARSASMALARASGRMGDGMGSDIAEVDVLEVEGGLLDRGVGTRPARLPRDDLVALLSRDQDRARERVRRAAPYHLACARQDVADVRGI